MTLTWLSAVTAFALVTCFTPGPNNTMLMASGLNFGFARTVPHLLGVSIGFAVMVLAVALGISGLFAAVPALFSLLKVVSVIYLLWLAWRIATAAPAGADADGHARPFNFLEAAAFQWVNPKAWIMAVGASATYVVAAQATVSVLVIALIFLLSGLASSSSWALGGTALRRLLASPRTVRAVNVAMAVLLVASLWPIIAEWLGS